MSTNHIVIAMSGGVDSSVSAPLLKEQGYKVTGVSLQLYDPIPKEPGCRIKSCCSLDDVLDAGQVAKKLGNGILVYAAILNSSKNDLFSSNAWATI
jgi:tRNA U34 2-thiouridine synthase MnmA/TrmU